ncbi:CinA-related protein [hydrothermal vent metagenome]|uniref:CinA-related protein n=1 Tax=hydrothermal vent metagenome TaxID=652676 RepID=A0A1W1C7I4_9ZZZZ
MGQAKVFALIIGTEILNRRRVDKHFDFVSTTLLSYGQKLAGSFIIEDDPALIIQTIRFISSQPNAILFSFGGIGSTPDDHTRKCAAVALRDGELVTNQEVKKVIEDRLKERAYPHPIKMAELPKRVELIENSFNGMPAFSIDDRYYFMPGFPEMSHPMVTEISKRLFKTKSTYHRYTLTARCKENLLIDVMNQMPDSVEFSSLPKYHDDGWSVTISVASHNDIEAMNAFKLYTDELDREAIPYILEDNSEGSSKI